MSPQPKAIIFARVSSRTQENEGYSLDSQLKLLRNYCKKKKLDVVKEFKIAETASKAERRRVFNELLIYITKNKIYHFAVEKTDRAVRNIKDAAAIYDWIEDDERRVLHCVKEGLELHKWSTSQVKFMWGIFVTFAKQYTDSLREEAMKGWDEKLAQGWLPAVPPPGYMTVTEDGKRVHVPDPANSMLIEPLFKFALLPDSTVAATAQEAANLGFTTRKGKPLVKSAVHRLLTNPFYIGTNRFNGKEYPGAQEPLISKELFYSVQEKIHGGRRPNIRKHNPVFKGMIRCIHCKSAVTWQKQKGRYYGLCQRRLEVCKHKRMLREDRLEDRLVSTLKKIRDPQGKILAKLQAALSTGRPDGIVRKHRVKVIKSLQKQLVRLQEMTESLYDDRLTGYISKEKHTQKHAELVAQMSDVQTRIARLHEAQGQTQNTDSQSDNQIVDLYLQGLPSQKRIIISYLYKTILTDGDNAEFKRITQSPLQPS